MKKIPQLLASLSLSLLTMGAFGQSSITLPKSTLAKKTVLTNPGLNNHPNKPTSSSSPGSAYLWYPYSDFTLSSSHKPYYAFPEIELMNSRYNLKDSSGINQLLIQSCAVAFDTLYDAATGTTYPIADVSKLEVDTIWFEFGQENHSGKNDTIQIEINKVNSSGIPVMTSPIYTKQIITKVGLSPMNNWLYPVDTFVVPKQAIAGNGKFAVSIQYFGGVTDTFGFTLGFPRFLCTTSGDTLVNMTQFGVNVVGGLIANSFTTGYQDWFSNTVTTLPNSTDGDYFGDSCTSPHPGLLFIQDINIETYVSFMVTGINTINPNGLNVGQNYPNPFKGTTDINYSVKTNSFVDFNVYDITGRSIMSNKYTNVTPGEHIISLSSSQLSAGIYFYTFNVNGYLVTKKMVIQ
jgi:hypothetical protein